jgi:transmembrane sensor
MTTPEPDERIATEAAEWVLRLEEDCGQGCRTEFVTWLQRSPAHLDEFLLVEASYRAIHQFDPQRRLDLDGLITRGSAEIIELRDRSGTVQTRSATTPETPARPKSHATPGSRLWLKLIGGTAVALLAGGYILDAYFFSWHVYRTEAGEQRYFKLTDGSLLRLNTQSLARVHYTLQAREVRLEQGEAMFTVSHNTARPFRVFTASATVQAVGTMFNIYQRPDETTEVSVVEGSVSITTPTGDTSTMHQEHPSAPFQLGQGEQAGVTRAGEVAKYTNPSVAQATAWQQRQLVFRDTTIAEAVMQFNRYNSQFQLRVASDLIGRRKITGTFDADEPQTLIAFLKPDPMLELQQQPNGCVIRLKATPAAHD